MANSRALTTTRPASPIWACMTLSSQTAVASSARPRIFRTTIEIPANAPIGFYSVTTFLFADGVMLARNDESFTIVRTGFEQLTFTFAREEAFIYGLVCVALALFTGWLAGVIFRRD